MTTTWLLACALALAAADPAPPERAPAEILRALQARYDATRSLRMEFEETYASRATGRDLVETGVIVAEKPGRMRWEYREPEPKLFVLAADVAWFHVPSENVVYRMRATAEDARRIPALFLAGKGSFERDFEATRAPSADGSIRLVLAPRAGSEDWDRLEIALEPATLALLAIEVTDVLGNTTAFRFSHEERDVAIGAHAFDFEPPRGAEIVEAEDAAGGR